MFGGAIELWQCPSVDFRVFLIEPERNPHDFDTEPVVVLDAAPERPSGPEGIVSAIRDVVLEPTNSSAAYRLNADEVE